MKYLKYIPFIFCYLYFWQCNSQSTYKPVSEILEIEMDTNTVNFSEKKYFKNKLTDEKVEVLHSLENTGFHFYNSVSFKDKEQGIIAGGSGLRIRVTKNGGKAWKGFSFSRFANAFYSTVLHNKNYFVVGASRYIFRSGDFGENWEILDVSKLAENKYGLRHPTFYKIKFSPDGFGLIMGENSEKPFFLRTNDDGKNWQLVEANGLKKDERLVSDAVIFPDHTIRIVTSKGNVYESKDKAKNWTLLRSGKKNESLNAIAFKSKKEGYVSGLRRLLLKTKDGGKTWQEIDTEVLSHNANISNLAYLPNNHVILTTAESFQDQKFKTFVYSVNKKEAIQPYILKENEKAFTGDAYGLYILKKDIYILDRDKLYRTKL